MQVDATGIEESRAEMLTAYPVPAIDDVLIPIPLALRNARYVLHDAQGRVVATGSATTEVLRVDVRALAPGAYALCISHGTSSAMCRILVAADR